MTDDGRSFIYHNRVTGQTTSELPTNGGGHDDFGGLARHRQSPAGSLPIRASVELQRKQVQDWERRTRLALEDLLKQSNKPTLAFLIDNVTDALREVFEATVAGSAADEEMSRAHDMGSESGMATAAMREEAAREMLAEAHTTTLAVLRELLASFGYVGPLDKMEELPRPAWATDVTLIGSIGLLSSNVHAAVTSRVGPESGLTVWSEVMRTATRLRDVVVDLPHRIGIHDTVEGKRLGAWLGIDTFDILGGRWGFGATKPGTIDEDLQPLDQNLVVELQRIKSECESVARAGEILDLMRVGSKFEKLLSTAEIASIIDIDGEVGDDQVSRARLEDLELYMDLVGRARKSLLELDTAYTSFTPNCVKLLTNPTPTPFLVTLDRCFTAISTLLVVTREQNALLSQSQIRGSVGFRSSLYRLHRQKPRPQSMVSQVSGTSRTSRASRLSDMDEMRRKAKSMEQEYADEEQYQERLREIERQKDIERERERVAAAASASASQTSLSLRKSISGRAGRTHRTASAASSSTSLAFKDTESESGSTKGTNRSSFMRFMKGRSSEDDGSESTPASSRLIVLYS
jgi:son of sevenless-like protein